MLNDGIDISVNRRSAYPKGCLFQATTGPDNKHEAPRYSHWCITNR